MKQGQLGLVLWKDIRALWRELCVYAVVLLAFGFAETETRPGEIPDGLLSLFITLLKFLMPSCWLFLIARSVHSDNLLGDDQFWVTRPYRWQWLLAAKLSFTAVAVAFPFVLMQWAILWFTGLDPFAAKTGMAISLIKFALIVWLPFQVLASVTETVTAMFTAVAGLLVVWGGALGFLLSGTNQRMSPPYELPIFAVIFGGLMIGILFYQYATRNTVFSRSAAAATAGLFLILVYGYDGAGFGLPITALIRNHYPVNASLRLRPLARLPYDERKEDMDVSSRQIELKLPAQIDGLNSKHMLRDIHAAVVLQNRNVRYASRWETSALTEEAIGIVLPKEAYDQLVVAPVRVHLELVGVELSPDRIVHSTMQSSFPGPMSGVCSLVKGKVFCQYAYREWVPTQVKTDLAIEPCDRSPSPTGAPATLRRIPAGTNPEPVVKEALSLRGKFCPGDQIDFTEYKEVGNFRLPLDLTDVNLAMYRVSY